MSELEKPSPVDQGKGDALSNSDLGNIVDPDAGLSEAEKKEAVSFFLPRATPLYSSLDSDV